MQSICTVKAGCFGSVRQELSTVMTGIREKILFGHTCDIETFSVLGENGVDAPGQKADIVAERITFSMKEGRLYSHFFTDGKRRIPIADARNF